MTMDRLTDINQARVDELRASRIAESDAGADDDLTGRIDANGFDTTDESGLLVDRINRPHVSYYQIAATGKWVPTAAKENDDVLLFGCIPGRVIGAGRGRSSLAMYNIEFFGDAAAVIETEWISDRAPADPNEEPMPIIVPEPEET